jgi:hypothetical protein
MARDYLSIVRRIEAVYPAAKGTANSGNHDQDLQPMLVRWADDLIQEIDQQERWSGNYSVSTQVTTQGTATYTLPATVGTVKNIYYINSAGGRVQLDKYEDSELMRVMGAPTSTLPPQGAPRWWSLLNRIVTIYPTPDASGPDTNNYTLRYETYVTTLPIVATTGDMTTTTTLTVPSTAFLTSAGVTTGAAVSVRGAGALAAYSVADDLVTTVSTVAATGTTSTLATAATTAVTAAQTFFNSQPWVITYYPKLMYFGILREVASYLSDDPGYQKWEPRYQLELKLAREFEFDRTMTLDSYATAQPGQRDSQLRPSGYSDGWGYDIRGG